MPSLSQAAPTSPHIWAASFPPAALGPPDQDLTSPARAAEPLPSRSPVVYILSVWAVTLRDQHWCTAMNSVYRFHILQPVGFDKSVYHDRQSPLTALKIPCARLSLLPPACPKPWQPLIFDYRHSFALYKMLYLASRSLSLSASLRSLRGTHLRLLHACPRSDSSFLFSAE